MRSFYILLAMIDCAINSDLFTLAANEESPAALYHVWFDAKGECELLPNDKSRVLNTQPVKELKIKE